MKKDKTREENKSDDVLFISTVYYKSLAWLVCLFEVNSKMIIKERDDLSKTYSFKHDMNTRSQKLYTEDNY